MLTRRSRSFALLALLRRASACVSFVTLLVVASTQAHADEADGKRPLAVHGDAYAGYANEDRAGDGLIVGLDALVRWRFLEVGALAESASGRKETVAGVGLMAGIGYYRLKAVGFDLVGVFGAHFYDHVGQELAAPGASGSVPFLQARLGVSFLPLKPFTFGGWFFYGDDLGRVTKNYSVTDNAPGGTSLTRVATIGEPAYGAMLRLGFDLPL